MYNYLINNSEEDKHFRLFVEGNERGLKYFNDILSKPLMIYAQSRIHDTFVSETIIQEVFLDAWKYRQKMESASHVRGFIRQGVRWMCNSYLKSRDSKRKLMWRSYDTWENFPDIAYEEDNTAWRQELQDLLEKAIPYLEKSRQTMMELYRQGISPGKIASAVEKSCQFITWEIKASVESLKMFITRLKQAKDISREPLVSSLTNYAVYLKPDEQFVLKCYYEEKLSISEIAKAMGLAPFQVTKIFFTARDTVVRINAYRQKKGNTR